MKIFYLKKLFRETNKHLLNIIKNKNLVLPPRKTKKYICAKNKKKNKTKTKINV